MLLKYGSRFHFFFFFFPFVFFNILPFEFTEFDWRNSFHNVTNLIADDLSNVFFGGKEKEETKKHLGNFACSCCNPHDGDFNFFLFKDG